jgi:pyrroline-5-carboxylate reductase
MSQLLLVGGGRMGEALAQGLLQAGSTDPRDLTIVEASGPRREALRKLFPGVTVTDTALPAEGAVLAVKPDGTLGACAALTAAGGAARVLSIAAGVTVAALEGALPAGTAVIRAMPNTPALVGAGASAISAGHAAGPDDLAWAADLLGAVGTVTTVPETLLDAVTGLSGSGPAYVFLIAEALIDAGVLAGLPRATASALTAQTLLGAARLLTETGEEPAALRAAVTSPGGTTAAGLQVLEQAGVRGALLDAVTAATRRSRELGQG